MATGRTSLLNLPLPTEGELDGSWGDMVNKGLTEYLDIAIAGVDSLTSANFTAGALTLANTTGTDLATNIAATSAQYATLRVSSLVTNSTITAPSSSRSYRIINADATYSLTIKASGQTGVTLQPGQSAVVAYDGTDYVFVGVVLGAAQTFTAAQTFRASNAIRSEAASTQDAVVVAGRAGGTSSYAATITPTTLSANRTLTIPDASGTILQSGTTVTVSQGGTGATTLTANNVILGNGTSAVQFVAPGSNGNVLTSNGTTWTSTTPASTTTLTISNKTGAYTIVAGDLGKIINCTSGTFTVSLTAAATLGSGFNVTIWNTGTGTITIDPNASETIDGVTTIVLYQGEGTQIVCNGTNWETGDKKTMRLYAENLNAASSRPVATGITSLAIGSLATASGGSSVAVGHFVTASGSSAMAFGSGVATTSATGTESLAIGSRVTCSANYGTAIGQNSGTSGSQATGTGATALGGSYASGTDSFAAAIGNNTSSYGATGANSVAMGYQCKATGTSAIAIGRSSSSTTNRAICIGNSLTSSADTSVAIGNSSSASGSYSVALGLYASSTIYGKFAYASGVPVAAGDCQLGIFVLRASTTDATATVLTTNGSAASTDNQVILPNNSAYAFTGTVVARRQASGGTQSAAWKVEGLIRREGSAGTTTLVASTVTAISNVPGWTLALSADTTNGGLAVTATGAAATNIRWVATIDSSEVTYA